MDPLDPRIVDAGKKAAGAAQSLSERISAICVAVLGFSIGFRSDFIGESSASYVWMLHLSWLCIVVSLVLSLFYSYAPIDMAESQITFLLRNPKSESATTVVWRGFIWGFRASLILFGVGMVFLVCFGYWATK